jgi:hypothetical protein
MDFNYDGENTPPPLLNFDSPLFGLRYSRPNFDLSIGYGRQDARDTQSKLQMIDATLLAWGGIPLTGRGSRTQILLPILVNSAYRAVGESLSVSGEINGELFSFTMIGLGTGLGVNSRLSESISINARVTPAISLVLRSFEGSVGTNRMLDGAIEIHLAQLVGDLGLTLGYTYRGQSWNIDGNELNARITEDVFDYKSTQQMFWIGVNF